MKIKLLIEKHIQSKPEFSLIDSSKIYCNACNVHIRIRAASVKFCINSHETSGNHQRSMRTWIREPLRQKSVITCAIGNKFPQDLAEMMINCNIPLYTLAVKLKRTPDLATLNFDWLAVSSFFLIGWLAVSILLIT